MPLKNTPQRYGWLSIALHWSMAIAVIGMFALGLWMRDLSYYDPWYRDGPFIHKSVGIILLMMLVLRVLWRASNIRPDDAPSLKTWERITAHLTHLALYALLFAIMLAGYLISTADGRSIEVFDWFSVPATLHGLSNQEDIAGEVHEILAWLLMAIVAVHSLAALKHHFFDRDNTLKKMLGIAANPATPTSAQKEDR
ncbi:cytochrome b [Spongiibacter sp. KMU-166]|uniref:Cytochrome b n=1 Tax=Spongiibacter thalassae TaxID=2721624 RepID=A0ABX1GGX1_9GAMM|nr:cytochrome b [Spongiibacter thalassae]NKI18449.1 cytochrome b [Spongiibacter thalassae]